MERKKKKRQSSFSGLLFVQILLTGVVLCVFALFHHVIPQMELRKNGLPEPLGTVERQPTPTTQAAEETALPMEVPPPTPEPWSVRFAEQFSETAMWEELSYHGPALSVTVTPYEHPEAFPRLSYYVADVYVADLSLFRTGFPAAGTFDSAEGIAAANGAVLAVNGDSMLTQRDGFLVRNGEIYKQIPNSGDLCVLYYDGVMEICPPEGYTVEEILAREPYQIWQFGPSLLDEDGSARESFNISSVLQELHPRTALGYYEPGHYCLVVVDGRQPGYSDGADIHTLAQIMSSLGCKLAYNLDGGASSRMVFAGKTVNRPSGDRYINDMLVFGEIQGMEGAER